MATKAIKIRTKADVNALMEMANHLEGTLTSDDSGLRSPSSVGALTKAYEFILDEIDWTSGTESMFACYRKKHAESNKAVAAALIHNTVRRINLRQEASTASMDVPIFTKQLMLMIARSQASLFAPQLWRTMPMNQPTARIGFYDTLYDSSFTNSTPNVAAGDRTDDLAKFNPGYFANPEAVPANRVKATIKELTVQESTYAVGADWTDRFVQDAMSQWNLDMLPILDNQITLGLNRTVDWQMVLATYNAVINANVNVYSWKAQPDGSVAGQPNYANLDVANQRAYDQTFWSIGVQNVISKIRKTRQYSDDDAYPTWALCGTNIPLQLARVDGYHAQQTNAEINVATGPLRDMGTLIGSGIRFMVSPLVDNLIPGGIGANTVIFGHQPQGFMYPGVDYMPYIPLTMRPPLTFPMTGVTERAAFTRFAIGKPDTTAEPASVQLGHIYGVLQIT